MLNFPNIFTHLPTLFSIFTMLCMFFILQTFSMSFINISLSFINISISFILVFFEHFLAVSSSRYLCPRYSTFAQICILSKPMTLTLSVCTCTIGNNLTLNKNLLAFLLLNSTQVYLKPAA